MALNQFTSPEGDLDNYLITESWLIDQWVGDTLWTWGQNNRGQLGDNTATNRSTPVTTLAGGANWKQVASGVSHTAAIKTDGTLWTWGYNDDGELAINNTTNRSTPVTTFAGGTDWKQVSSGRYHTAAIKTDGTLWTWGFGSSGILGNAQITNKSTPITTFAGGTDWKQVSGGYGHTAAVKTDGTLWIWGTANSGRLGNAIQDFVSFRSTPVTTFAGGTNWKQVDSGSLHVAAIKTDGTLWTWGGGLGELGTGTFGSSTPVTTFAGGTNWKQVSAAGYFSAAIKTDGTLWTWGDNTSGRLGNASTTGRSTPVTTFAGGTNWKQLDCGYNRVLAVTTGISPNLPLS